MTIARRPPGVVQAVGRAQENHCPERAGRDSFRRGPAVRTSHQDLLPGKAVVSSRGRLAQALPRGRRLEYVLRHDPTYLQATRRAEWLTIRGYDLSDHHHQCILSLEGRGKRQSRSTPSSHHSLRKATCLHARRCHATCQSNITQFHQTKDGAFRTSLSKKGTGVFLWISTHFLDEEKQARRVATSMHHHHLARLGALRLEEAEQAA